MRKPNFIPYSWGNFDGFNSWILNLNLIWINWWLCIWLGSSGKQTIITTEGTPQWAWFLSRGSESLTSISPEARMGQEFPPRDFSIFRSCFNNEQVWRIKGLEEKIKGNGKRCLLGKILGRGTWQRQSRALWE